MYRYNKEVPIQKTQKSEENLKKWLKSLAINMQMKNTFRFKLHLSEWLHPAEQVAIHVGKDTE